MFNNEGGNSSKRKMKEVATEPMPDQFNIPQNPPPPPLDIFNFESQNPPSPVRPQSLTVQRILNATATPIRPFYFTSLLTDLDLEEDYHLYNQDQIDRIITSHNENLKNALKGVLDNHRRDLRLHREAEQLAKKKLNETGVALHKAQCKNAELERLVDMYKTKSKRMVTRVRYLERTTVALRASLKDANEARMYAEREEEDAESSFVDPDRVGPVRLDCRACEGAMATVMMWPCRHVCVCAGCNVGTMACPVCQVVKTDSLEVCLPTN